MILFSDANGTIQTNFGTPVYQGSANSNIIYLIAPYAPAASVLVGFQLPDGSAVAPVAMTPLNAVPGVQNAGGTSYAGWSYVLPAAVTAKYGTVTAQFFFYAPTGESTNPTSIIATSATSFQVGRGAAAVLPDTPDADVYESILSNLAQLQTDLNGGYYGARAIFPWSNGATYGLNEITFYPSIGTYGAFVQSVAAGNTNNAPYVDGALNSAYWKEVVNFNTVTEDYFQQVQEAVAQAESAASEAENSAQAAAGSASAAAASAAQAAGNEEATNMLVERAMAYAEQAEVQANIASQAATSALRSEEEAQQSAQRSEQSATESALSATAAQQYAQQAQQYAQKHYQVVASVAELPRPGDSAFIYLVPTGSGTSNDSYSEYLWITESNDYEFIGTTADIDLSNYAQINGTYAGMTVGNATNAQTATNAQQLGGVAAANYAQINGTYSGMTVGNATNATNADTADSATSAQDSAKLGGVAASEYALQSQLPVANPTATGTQELTSLQVDGTVYNVPATEIVFSTDAASGAAEVSGFSVEGQNFAFNLQNNNCVIGKTISNPTTGITYIKCTLSGTVSAAGNYFFVNCSGTLTVSGTSTKLFVTGSPSLTISGITSDNWRNVYIDGEASYIARNSSITVNLNETVTVATGIGNTAAEFYEVNMSIPDNSNRILRGYGNMAYSTPNYDNSKVEYVEFKIDTSGNLTFKPVYGEATFLITWVKFTRRI